MAEDLAINATMFPLRLSMSADKGKAMELTIDLTNKTNDTKMLSFDLVLPEAVGADRGGMLKKVSKNFDAVKSGETVSFKMPILLSPRAQKGSFSGKIQVTEHFNDYDYAMKYYTREILFRVVD